MKCNAILKIGVLIEDKEKLLLIKEQSWKHKQLRWNIIKGTYDPLKDKNLTDTATRESFEEARAKIQIKSLLNILYLKKNNQPFIQFNFIAELKSIKKFKKQSTKIINHDDGRKENIVEVKLFSKDELKKLKPNELMGERTHVAIKDWLAYKPTTQSKIQILKIVKNY